MKKIFSFAAVLFAAMTINAQKVVVLNEVANYVDFQAEYVANPAMANFTVTTTDHYEFENGTTLVGYAKSDGTEQAMQWNTKDDYNTTCQTPEWEGVDSLTVGTMWRPASGGTIEVGEFETSADGKLYVYFQPNGDSDRGVSITYNGNTTEFAKSGVKGEGGMRPIYAASIDLTKGYYSKGEVVIKVITNTTNIFGIGIENLGAGTAVENVAGAAKAQKVIENGQIYIIKNGAKYNVLGAQVAE